MPDQHAHGSATSARNQSLDTNHEAPADRAAWGTPAPEITATGARRLAPHRLAQSAPDSSPRNRSTTPRGARSGGPGTATPPAQAVSALKPGCRSRAANPQWTTSWSSTTDPRPRSGSRSSPPPRHHEPHPPSDPRGELHQRTALERLTAASRSPIPPRGHWARESARFSLGQGAAARSPTTDAGRVGVVALSRRRASNDWASLDVGGRQPPRQTSHGRPCMAPKPSSSSRNVAPVSMLDSASGRARASRRACNALESRRRIVATSSPSSLRPHTNRNPPLTTRS